LHCKRRPDQGSSARSIKGFGAAFQANKRGREDKTADTTADEFQQPLALS